jgi:hypothetical protein
MDHSRKPGEDIQRDFHNKYAWFGDIVLKFVSQVIQVYAQLLEHCHKRQDLLQKTFREKYMLTTCACKLFSWAAYLRNAPDEDLEEYHDFLISWITPPRIRAE